MSSTANATCAYIGVCGWAGHRFRSETSQPKWTYCPKCDPYVGEAHGREWVQRSMVKWAGIRARLSTRQCSDVCTSAKSQMCVCACGGANHGKSLGPPL